MILTIIFRSAAVTAVHTGVAAGIATAMDSNHVAAAAFSSFAVGIPALIGGAFIGDAVASPPHNIDHGRKGATIGGLVGYAAGSVLGFALQYS